MLPAHLFDVGNPPPGLRIGPHRFQTLAHPGLQSDGSLTRKRYHGWMRNNQKVFPVSPAPFSRPERESSPAAD